MLASPLNNSLKVSPSDNRRLGFLTTALIVLSFVALILFYLDTAKSIVAIWNSSETFAHGYIILPISLALIWRRRANFIIMPPTPYWPALALLLGAGFGWLLARMGEVQVVMQYAFVAMIPLMALALLGRRLASSLAFPLLFVLLAVPFGEIFIDPLISFTADFTVWALQMTGIPVLRNGTRFEIPSGSWSVVEACSGVRYLISSVTLGGLYAYLTYRSTTRRVLFMIVSVVVPIVANGLRAYMIVMIGHLSGMTLAVGVDHIIYGWLFFGLVMFIMFWIGSYWREDEDDVDAAPVPPPESTMPEKKTVLAHLLLMAVLIECAVGIWPVFAHYNDHANYNSKTVKIDNVAISWPPAQGFSGWTPHYANPAGQFNGVYQTPAPPDLSAQSVGLAIYYYRNQRNGKALISSTNRLVDYEEEMHSIRPSVRSEKLANRVSANLVLREETLQSQTGNILVWYWYWIDNQYTASNYGGKLLQAKAKLLFRGDDGAVIMVSTPVGNDPELARSALRVFLSANLPAIDHALVSAKEN